MQAPHSPSAQPSLVPVSPRSNRSQSSSVWPAALAARRSTPLTAAVMVLELLISRRDGSSGADGAGKSGTTTRRGGLWGQVAASVPAARERSARSTTTSTVWLRYSAVDRRSSMGVTAAREAAATSAAASLRSRPLAMPAAASTSSMVGPTLPRATTRSDTVPSLPSVTTAAAWTTEMA